MFEFRILKKSKRSGGRIGQFKTPHGILETPAFLPVATIGAVKTVLPQELKDAGAQIVLANTYHLYLRPGDKTIKKLGGLHFFMNWNKPILTDSGGFQIFSLSERKYPERAQGASRTDLLGQGSRRDAKIKIGDRGVKFFSHLDGSEHFLSPEKSIAIQNNLGADIIMTLDICSAAGQTKQAIAAEMQRTHRWLERCIRAHRRDNQALFGIVQGGVYQDLREESARFVVSQNLAGNAIGGVSVGEPKEEIYRVIKTCNCILPENKPRYVMGIGYPEDIWQAIQLGADLFDCVLPTRLGRTGTLWIRNSRFSIRNSKSWRDIKNSYQQVDLSKPQFREDKNPLDLSCRCPACVSGFSRAYISHLVREKEILGLRLCTLHNLYFVFDLIKEIKNSL